MAIPPGMGQNQRQFCDVLKEEIKRELDPVVDDAMKDIIKEFREEEKRQKRAEKDPPTASIDTPLWLREPGIEHMHDYDDFESLCPSYEGINNFNFKPLVSLTINALVFGVFYRSLISQKLPLGGKVIKTQLTSLAASSSILAYRHISDRNEKNETNIYKVLFEWIAPLALVCTPTPFLHGTSKINCVCTAVLAASQIGLNESVNHLFTTDSND
jgi:hypothetical protein